MNNQTMQAVIEAAIPCEFVLVESADNVHFYATVVSTAFQGITKIKQHKIVKNLFTEQFADDSIHALSLKTFTPEKWAALQAENK